MCGFVGSFPEARPEQIRSGLAKIEHRGPDEQHLVNTPLGTLGHARLSILDVAAGHQPMQNGNRWIVFNGEIYNYQKLREQLRGPFRTDSDTEVILRLYEEKKNELPRCLDGMFAFALQTGEDLLLVRDPLGIKPLYYVFDQDNMFFASEIKALLPVSTQIHLLPPGFLWHSRTGLQPFDTLDGLDCVPEEQPSFPYEAVPGILRYNLHRAVARRLIADEGVKVGVSLSGGLDSSIIAALARLEKEQVETFAVGMAGSEDLEASWAMSRYLGTRHHTYTYTFEEMLQVLPEVIYHLESYDAALVRSAIPNYFLARLAADTVKVILTGEGADELFAGYEYLREIGDPRALHNELLTITRSLHNTNLQRTDRMTMAHGIEGRVPFLDRQMVEFAFRLPPQWKAPQPGRPEKELLRRAFSDLLPESITWRPKQKFSQGAGSMNLLAEYAHQTISDEEFLRERAAAQEAGLRSKEELLYYRIFTGQFGNNIPAGVIGRTRSVTQHELA